MYPGAKLRIDPTDHILTREWFAMKAYVKPPYRLSSHKCGEYAIENVIGFSFTKMVVMEMQYEFSMADLIRIQYKIPEDIWRLVIFYLSVYDLANLYQWRQIVFK